MEIIQARSEKHVALARQLFEEYVASLGVDLDFQGIERERTEFPGVYSPPDGRLLIALRDKEATGCVAVRNLGLGICEMKRLYVRPEYRGLQAGWRLAQAAIDAARTIGYQKMRLDTLPTMHEAIELYRSLGFVAIEPYTYNPIPGALFMELSLQ